MCIASNWDADYSFACDWVAGYALPATETSAMVGILVNMCVSVNMLAYVVYFGYSSGHVLNKGT
jgi:hypothetical protein